MKETQHSRRIGRSIGALLIGIFAGAILSFGTDELLHIAGIFPALGQSRLTNPPADERRATPARDGLSYGLQRRGELHRSATRARSTHATCLGKRCRGSSPSDGGHHRRYVESRTRAPLVFPCHHRTRDAVRLGGRQTPHDAVARTR
jgi:hypothetical protein